MDATPSGPGKQYWIVNEDQLRQLILDYSDEIRRDAKHMANMIAQIVKTDREKSGLDQPNGIVELTRFKEKKTPHEPDLTGTAKIGGRPYRAAAWFWGDDRLRVSLLPKEQK